MIEKYQLDISINPHNNKEAYREFFRKYKFPVNKKERVFSLLSREALAYITTSGTTVNTLLATSKEVEKYLVYLWQEDLLSDGCHVTYGAAVNSYKKSQYINCSKEDIEQLPF
jgi:hypothetical protein